jgi:hypothetical protein
MIDAQAFRLRLAQRQRIEGAAGGGQQGAADDHEGQHQPDLVQLLSASEPSSQFMIS